MTIIFSNPCHKLSDVGITYVYSNIGMNPSDLLFFVRSKLSLSLLHKLTFILFIQIGGVLVMPLNDQLLQIVRTSETTWDVKSVLPVSFATLLLPEKTDVKDQIKLRKYLVSQFLSQQDIGWYCACCS